MPMEEIINSCIPTTKAEKSKEKLGVMPNILMERWNLLPR